MDKTSRSALIETVLNLMLLPVLLFSGMMYVGGIFILPFLLFDSDRISPFWVFGAWFACWVGMLLTAKLFASVTRKYLIIDAAIFGFCFIPIFVFVPDFL
jgi:hypothetical protein